MHIIRNLLFIIHLIILEFKNNIPVMHPKTTYNGKISPILNEDLSTFFFKFICDQHTNK